MSVKLERYSKNPILSPNPDHEWESLVTTNPAAWLDEQSGDVLMLYRAAGHDSEHRVYLGLARSKDGLNFERTLNQPVFGPNDNGFDVSGTEDPRIVKFNDNFFITYAFRPLHMRRYWENENNRSYRPPNPPSEFPRALRDNLTSTGLAITKDFKDWIRAGRISDPRYDDRDVIIFPERVCGKFVTLHRPMEWCGPKYGTDVPAIWIAMSDDLLEPKTPKLLATAKHDWESRKLGGASPPLKTSAGWLMLYHAVGSDRHYRVGAMLLDLENPSIVHCRSHDWLLQPELEWEVSGHYNGVVFPCGNVVIDDTLFVYYGGGDIHCGVATCNLSRLIDYLLSCRGA